MLANIVVICTLNPTTLSPHRPFLGPPHKIYDVEKRRNAERRSLLVRLQFDEEERAGDGDEEMRDEHEHRRDERHGYEQRACAHLQQRRQRDETAPAAHLRKHNKQHVIETVSQPRDSDWSRRTLSRLFLSVYLLSWFCLLR